MWLTFIEMEFYDSADDAEVLRLSLSRFAADCYRAIFAAFIAIIIDGTRKREYNCIYCKILSDGGLFMKNVFISYGHIEYAKKAAELLYEKLDSYERDGEKLFKTFIDGSIPFGADWDVEIEHALKEADYMLFLSCEYSVRDESVCRDEISLFLELKKEKKNIIPVRLDSAIFPLSIIRNKFVTWTNHPDGIDEIMTRILSRLDSAPAGEPQPRESLHEKIWALIGKGDAEKVADNWNKAGEIYAKALAEARKYYKSEPCYDSHRDLSAVLDRIGRIAEKEDKITEAHKYYSEFLEIARKNAEDFPSYESRRNLSVSLNRMGDIAVKEDNAKEAKKYYSESLKIARQNAEDFPSYESRRGLSVSLEKMGDIALKENNAEEAKDYYLKALEIIKDFSEKFPCAENFCDLAECNRDCAKAEKALGNKSEAKKYLLEALDNADKSYKILPCKYTKDIIDEILDLLKSLY